MKNKQRIFLLVLIIPFLAVTVVSLSSAGFLKGADSFVLGRNIYGPGEIISGYINISLADEPADSALRASLGMQNISLLDFLSASGLVSYRDFTCMPTSCEAVYEAAGSSSLSKTLAAGNRLIGSMIIGRDAELQSDALEFSITASGSSEYCGVSPVQIDILADGSIDWTYTESSGKFCGSLLPSNCYNDAAADKSFDVNQNGYCEKIFLPVSSRFKLSSLVKKNRGGGDLSIFIYDKTTGITSECDLDEPNVTSFVEKSCIVDFSVLDGSGSQDYYICIQDNLANNAYSVKAETAEPLCGYAGLPDWAENASADFGLFVQPTGIAALDKTVKLNEIEFGKTHSESINEYLAGYIEEKYGGDCLKGCIIPISINSKDGAIVNDFSLSYCVQGLCKTESNIFSLNKKPAVIGMNFTKLKLEKANFSAPGYGNYTFSLWLGDEAIGSEEISVEKVPVIKSIVAISPEAAVPLQFFAEAYSPKDNEIVKYEWDFGDGSTETTTGGEAVHTYENVGWFDVTLRVTDSEDLTGSRTITLQVGSPRGVLNTTLAQKKSFLKNVSDEVESMMWYKSIVSSNLNLDELQDSIDGYEQQFRSASTDEEYVSLMNKVKQLVVPKNIYDAELIDESPIILDLGDIRPEYLEQLGAGLYEPEYAAETRNALWDWQWKNLDIRAGGRIIGVAYDDGSVDYAASVLTLKLKSKKSVPLDEVYLILLANYNKAGFEYDYGQKNIMNSVGFAFENLEEEKISMALQGKIDLTEIVIFSSPAFYELDIIPEEIVCNNNNKCEPALGESWRNCREDCKPIGLAVFYLILAVLVMFATYLLLQKWYKKNYEKHLFKNPQDINNLASFTAASLNKGMGRKEIHDKLKKAGWSSEQVDYAMKKVKGKRVGLPEINLQKVAEKIKFRGKNKER